MHNPDGLWHDPSWLQQQRAQGKTTRQMAAAAGCSRTVLEKRLHDIGLLGETKAPDPLPEPDDTPEQEPPDCLDCPLERGSCDGCAVVYETRQEKWVRC